MYGITFSTTTLNKLCELAPKTEVFGGPGCFGEETLSFTTMQLSEIQIRDPFVFPFVPTQTYYLFGTTDKNCWSGPGVGFDCYSSRDLETWDGPFPAFRPTTDFWGTKNFWAPEVHFHQGRFWMFATFAAPQRHRGIQILVSDTPEGPYLPWSEGPVSPPNWQCLDGTLWVNKAGIPWMVFCQEWMQVHDGAMFAQQLSADLKRAEGRPVFLFNASEAPWGKPGEWPGETDKHRFPIYVTDGPFLYTTRQGSLLMLWSSFGTRGYAMGLAHSTSGTALGPWQHRETPLWAENGGHGMVFRTFDGRLMLTFHSPNQTPNERAFFREIIEADDTLRLA
jgi:arabinan endo-1,5-alpha-L-arabinosidase